MISSKISSAPAVACGLREPAGIPVGFPAESRFVTHQRTGGLDHDRRQLALMLFVRGRKNPARSSNRNLWSSRAGLRFRSPRTGSSPGRSPASRGTRTTESRRLPVSRPRQARRDGADVRSRSCRTPPFSPRKVLEQHLATPSRADTETDAAAPCVGQSATACLDAIVGVAEDRAAPAHRVVEELVTLGVPDAAARERAHEQRNTDGRRGRRMPERGLVVPQVRARSNSNARPASVWVAGSTWTRPLPVRRPIVREPRLTCRACSSGATAWAPASSVCETRSEGDAATRGRLRRAERHAAVSASSISTDRCTAARPPASTTSYRRCSRTSARTPYVRPPSGARGTTSARIPDAQRHRSAGVTAPQR